MPFKDEQKDRDYKAEHYQKRKKQYQEATARKRKRNREYVDKIFEHGECTKCGEDHPGCLDFHHVDESLKEFPINIGIRDKGLETLKKEIAKCVLLCSNCHRKLHYEEQTGPYIWKRTE